MHTDILTPRALFRKDIHYTIPPFQRPYVWTQDDQWEPLWDDVRNMAENYLEELERMENSREEADQRTPPHFLGAVVLRQVSHATRDIEQREVIDGQQRMTTLQLLLDAVQFVFEESGLERASRRLSRLVTNDDDYIGANETEVFKLWPTTSDREAFRHAMHNGLATNNFEGSLIVQAHAFFQEQVKDWLNSEPDSLQDRADALESAVSGKLQMVVIDLDSNDDPHVIFETLNARGTPLLQSDLIKNYAVSRDGRAESGLWGGLDDNWWRREVGRGSQRRPRIDTLLNYWLIMRTASEVSISRVFDAFRSLADQLPIDQVMSDVRRDMESYRSFEDGSDRTPDEDMFRYRYQVMQAGAITPALLYILSAPLEKRIRALRALESFLIRRMVCRGSTRGYGRLAIELVGELQKRGIDNADTAVVNFLKEQKADYRSWPDDHALELSLDTLPLYLLLTRGRLRLILEGIEGKLRTSMAEELDVPKNLTIEHVMPRSWGANWPLPEKLERQEEANKRNRLVHTIGNLTLTNGRLNSALSNAAWEDKRKTLTNHFTLFLNKTLLNESEGKDWNEDFIQSRSKRMAKLVAEVWPGPDSPVWD